MQGGDRMSMRRWWGSWAVGLAVICGLSVALVFLGADWTGAMLGAAYGVGWTARDWVAEHSGAARRPD